MRAFLLTLGLLLGLAVMLNGAAEWLRARRDATMREVVAALQPGLGVADYVNVDERSFQKARLRVVPPPRIVAFGSSRVMQLTTAALAAAPGDFYNTGMSGATVEDYIAMWTLLDQAGKVPEMAIFALDPWILDEAHEQGRWRALDDEVDRYLQTSGSPWSGLLTSLDRAVYRWYQAKELLSYAVLRRSTYDLRRAIRRWAVGSRSAPGTWVITSEEDTEGRQLLLADGSLRYDRAILGSSARDRSAAAVRDATSIVSELPAFRWNAERLRRLERLWRDMRRRGVMVVAFLPPYHPVAWQMLRQNPRYHQTLGAGGHALDELAARVGVAFRDFSDPDSVPCAESEFFDGYHATAGCLGRLLRKLEGLTVR